MMAQAADLPAALRRTNDIGVTLLPGADDNAGKNLKQPGVDLVTIPAYKNFNVSSSDNLVPLGDFGPLVEPEFAVDSTSATAKAKMNS